MQRYFVSESEIEQGQVKIVGDDARHISKVMRMRPGDRIICCQTNGRAYLCSLSAILDGEVIADIEQELDENHELPIRIALAQGLPKGDKLDWIVQKGTELGAEAFILFQAERAVVKWEGAAKIARKRDRLKKIAKEAAEQSHRNKIPDVTEPLSILQLIEASKHFDYKVVAYEEEAKSGAMKGLSAIFGKMKPKESLLTVIGPEGGLSESEIAALDDAGFTKVALGKRILRTETAGLYLLSAASYHFELLE